MEKVTQLVRDFFTRVKDDPALSDLFRAAAAEIHAELEKLIEPPPAPAEPPPATPVEPPAEPSSGG